MPFGAIALFTIIACDVNQPKTETAGAKETPAPIVDTSIPTAAPTGLSFPPRQNYAHYLRITSKYDQIDDYTTVDLDEMNLGGLSNARRISCSAAKNSYPRAE